MDPLLHISADPDNCECRWCYEMGTDNKGNIVAAMALELGMVYEMAQKQVDLNMAMRAEIEKLRAQIQSIKDT